MKSSFSFSVLLLLFCLLFRATHFYAQQPAYTIFGEEQFRGIQIYDVIQDNSKNFWISTSEGLFKYNFISFEKIECSQSKSSSVFNFVKDKNGIIYCHNINNQVFKIEKDKYSLLYELKKEEASIDISLAIGNDNNLLISSRNIIAINSSGKVINRLQHLTSYISKGFCLSDKSILFQLNKNKEVILYKNGNFKRVKLKSTITPQVLRFFNYKDKIIASEIETNNLYELDIKNKTLKFFGKNDLFASSQMVRLYENSKGIWLAGTLPGCFHITNILDSKKSEQLYSEFYISDVYIDHEGNLLLSTFDKGIIVIPDIHTPDVLMNFKDDPISSISTVGKDQYIGTSKGRLIKLDKQNYSVVNKNLKRPLEVLKSNKSGSKIVFDDGEINLLDNKTGQIRSFLIGSLKDITYVDEQSCYLGTNLGVFYLNFTNIKGSEKRIKHYTERVHHLDFNQQTKTLFVSSISGVSALLSNGQKYPIRYKGKEIYPLDIVSEGDYTYISTKEEGVLVFKNQKYIRQIRVKELDKTLAFEKILFFNKNMIANTSNGLFLILPNGKIKKSFHTLYGFPNKRIIDFCIQGNQLWVCHSDGIQKIDIEKPKNDFVQKLHIRIDQILINGSPIKSTNDKLTLSSSERKIQFIFTSPTLRNREQLNYFYRLKGTETDWTISNFQNNQVTFNSLAPGKYQFELKVENNGKYSEIQSVYFTIKAPFYQTWWFILLSIVSFLLIVFYSYKRQLAKQKRKSDQINELYASKLTAIQSQMNPHFIFNSLNSIQDLILKGDVEHSYSYITTFSNLVRKTLSHSEKDFIDFEEEVKHLELYLSLEKLRFKKDFNYTIEADDIDDISLPPLLIQPFIENSLVHGLLHKEGNKVLKIRFELAEELICTIEDNGIGREKAKEIKLRKRSEHESFSGKAIERRFEIFSSIYNGNFSCSYDDLYDDGVAAGTKVTLKIPIRRKF